MVYHLILQIVTLSLLFSGFKMFSNDLFRYSPDGADPANETDLSDEETDEASEDDSPGNKYDHL